MPLVFPYSRVSTGKQATGSQRSGVSRQAQSLTHWLTAWPGFTVAEEIADLGVSAFRGANQQRNRGLGRWLAAAEAGLIPGGSILLVEDHRRYSRREPVEALGSVINSIWGAGLGFAVCSYEGGRPLFRADAKAQHLALLAFLFEQAHQESSEKSRWSAAARAKERERQDQGQRTDGRAPWWLARDPATGRLLRDPAGGLVVEADHGNAIRRACELATSGLGMVLIARQLTEEGFSPPPTSWAKNQHRPSTAREWSPGVVSRTLAHPALIGTLMRRDGALPGYYPPLLSEAEHQVLRASIEQRDAMKGRIRGLSMQCRNLFQGMVRCASCSGPMSYCAPAKRARVGHPGYISCPASRRGVAACSNTGAIPYDWVESHCLSRLSESDWEAFLHRPGEGQIRAEAHQAALDATARKQALEGQLARVRAAIAEAWMNDPGAPRLRTLEDVREDLRQELAAAVKTQQEAERELRAIEARPSGAEAAADLRSRVGQFWWALPTATPAERLAFNRWLLSRQPAIEFRLGPKPTAGGDRLVSLLLDGRRVSYAQLAGPARVLARERGMVDPALAVSETLPDGNIAVVLLERGPEPAPPPRGQLELIDGGHILVLNPSCPAADAEPPDDWPWSALLVPGLGSDGGAASISSPLIGT